MTTSDKDNIFGCAVVITTIVVVFCAFCGGVGTGIEWGRSQAVDAGHAEYFLDSEHQKMWRWKPIPEGKDE